MKKESTASFFVNFERNRVTKEPAYITAVAVIAVADNKQTKTKLNVYCVAFVISNSDPWMF